MTFRVISDMATPKQKKCAARDCDVRFVPAKPWQKFHHVRCKNKELQARRRERQKAATA
jgi:hypothetical protein